MMTVGNGPSIFPCGEGIDGLNEGCMQRSSTEYYCSSRKIVRMQLVKSKIEHFALLAFAMIRC